MNRAPFMCIVLPSHLTAGDKLAGPLAQLELLDLAAFRLRQHVDEPDMFRRQVAAELITDESSDLVAGHSCPGCWDHESTDDFAVLFIGDPNDRDVRDVRMSQEAILNFQRMYVLPCLSASSLEAETHPPLIMRSLSLPVILTYPSASILASSPLNSQVLPSWSTSSVSAVRSGSSQ